MIPKVLLMERTDGPEYLQRKKKGASISLMRTFRNLAGLVEYFISFLKVLIIVSGSLYKG